MKKLKPILGLGILGVVAFWIGLYAFNTQKPAPPPQKAVANGQASGNVGLKEINFTQVKDGVKLWDLKAEAVEYQKDSKVVSFKKVTLTYFPKDNKPITLVGNVGRLDTQTKNVSIAGEVIITSQEGYELRVPSLEYVDERKEVQTDGQVTLKGPHMNLEGQGMTMSLESQKVKVKSKARMTFYQAFFTS